MNWKSIGGVITLEILDLIIEDNAPVRADFKLDYGDENGLFFATQNMLGGHMVNAGWEHHIDGTWTHPNGGKLTPSDVAQWVCHSLECGQIQLPPPF